MVTILYAQYFQVRLLLICPIKLYLDPRNHHPVDSLSGRGQVSSKGKIHKYIFILS